jgi:error-prone DNA polymerase
MAGGFYMESSREPLGDAMRYAELHCKTNFSFLEGASHADELVARAKELGYAALAVTDRESLAGVVRAHIAAKETGLKLLIGAEVQPIDAAPAVLWATDRKAYGRLSRLLTVGRRRAEKGKCQLTLADIAEHAEGLIAGIVRARVQEEQGRQNTVLSTQYSVPSAESNFANDKPNLRLFCPDNDPSPQPLAPYAEIFPGRAYLLAELFHGPDDAAELDRLISLSKQTDLPLVAAGDVHYHTPARQPLFEVLTATRLGTTVDRLAEHRFANAERHLRPLDQIAALFSRVPEAIERTLEIAGLCQFSLSDLKYEYPIELVPAGFTPSEYLARLAWEGAHNQYPQGIPDKVRQLVERELALIQELRYEAYFLTVWDLVRFARERDILCQGRGSAANSAVCYCLGVTSIDPAQIEVLFERFVSKERNEAPDIDVDFEHERREEVLQYIYKKYGRDRAGMTGVVITYRTRSAIRDVGKALGLSLDRVDALAKNCEGRELDGYFYADAKKDKHEDPQPEESSKFGHPRSGSIQGPKLEGTNATLNFERGTSNSPVQILALRCAEVGIDATGPLGMRLVHLVTELVGFPRHLSQHVGGMVITQGPLCELAPIENAAMPGRTVIEWDKDDLDELGILKVDCLALGMLTAIRKCFQLIEKHEGRELTLANIPQDDPQVYDMIQQADTIGVFQIESRAQMSMLPRLKPERFYDLVIEVAIVRPGPIQGKMVHPYLRRRMEQEAVPVYPIKEIGDVLERTLGVPLFQEQAMQLAVVAAGFSPGEADQLRRAMGAWRRPGLIDQFHKRLIQGMLAKGLSEEFAERIFQQIRGFGEYGFPESHAASFALLVYVSAWLKCYYPAAFTAAIINSQPMGFYSPAQLIRDARSHGVPVLPADVNASGWDCGLENSGFRGQESDNCGARSAERGITEAVLGTQYLVLNNESRHEIQPTPDPRLPIPSLSLRAPRSALRTSISLRLGLRVLTGIPKAAVEEIEAAQRAGPFTSLDDFVRRTGLSQAVVAKLAQADAFSSLAIDRRAALWQALGQEKRIRQMPLLSALADDEPPAPLPPMPLIEQVFADYRTSELSLKAHPISFLRRQLDERRVTPARELEKIRSGRHLRVAGLVVSRQRPGTAKGITFATLEDETGWTNLVIRPAIWDRYYAVARRSSAWIAHGCLENKDSVIHLVVNRLEDLSAMLGDLKTHSRDFR